MWTFAVDQTRHEYASRSKAKLQFIAAKLMVIPVAPFLKQAARFQRMQSSSERMHRPDMTIGTEMPTSDWLRKGVLHAPCNNLAFGKNDRLSTMHILQPDHLLSLHKSCPIAQLQVVQPHLWCAKCMASGGEHNFRLVRLLVQNSLRLFESTCTANLIPFATTREPVSECDAAVVSVPFPTTEGLSSI